MIRETTTGHRVRTISRRSALDFEVRVMLDLLLECENCGEWLTVTEKQWDGEMPVLHARSLGGCGHQMIGPFGHVDEVVRRA